MVPERKSIGEASSSPATNLSKEAFPEPDAQYDMNAVLNSATENPKERKNAWLGWNSQTTAARRKLFVP